MDDQDARCRISKMAPRSDRRQRTENPSFSTWWLRFCLAPGVFTVRRARNSLDREADVGGLSRMAGHALALDPDARTALLEMVTGDGAETSSPLRRTSGPADSVLLERSGTAETVPRRRAASTTGRRRPTTTTTELFHKSLPSRTAHLPKTPLPGPQDMIVGEKTPTRCFADWLLSASEERWAWLKSPGYAASHFFLGLEMRLKRVGA